jgi:hypothetical protein
MFFDTKSSGRGTEPEYPTERTRRPRRRLAREGLQEMRPVRALVVEDQDALEASDDAEVRGQGLGGAVVAVGSAESVRARMDDLGVAGGREIDGQAGLMVDRDGLQGGLVVVAADDGQDFPVRGEFLGDLGGFFRLVLVVADDQLQGPAADAAGRVDLVDFHLRGVKDREAAVGFGARKGERGADADASPERGSGCAGQDDQQDWLEHGNRY